MKKRQMNPEIEVGDRIQLYHMEGEKIPPGTDGVVLSIVSDPDDDENKIIMVKWDDGSKLGILSKYDKFKLSISESITESNSPQYEYFKNNEEIFELFDWRFLKKYLKVIQKTGVINMFGASPLLYCGSEHLDRYYGEGNEDDESFQEALELADEAKQKMIEGTVKWLESKNKEVTVDNANRYISKLAVKILELYGTFY